MRVYSRVAGCLVVALFAAVSPVMAWWGFVHYRIAKDVDAALADYAMGPDTFPSRHGFSITAEFAWSHGVLTDGSDLLVPVPPTYPHDGRYPGKVMHELITRKLGPDTLAALTTGGGNTNADPLSTALGFVVHNASDNVVHWEYFLGGRRDSACNIHLLVWNWQTNHLYKEEWCNYIVLFLKDGRSGGGPIRLFPGVGDDNIMGTHDDIQSSLFEDVNGNGRADPGETDYTNDVFAPAGSDGQRRLQPYLLSLHPLQFKTNVRLQHLAMKVHRKNRRNSDLDSVNNSASSSRFEVQDVAATVASFESEITDMANNDLVNMTLTRFIELNVIASGVNAEPFACPSRGWYPNDVMARYDLSVMRAQAWLAAVGS